MGERVLPPVPLPDGVDGKGKAPVAAGRSRRKWVVPVVAAGFAVVLAVGGFGGYMAWDAHELDAARAACARAADRARVAANEYHALADGRAADVAATKVSDVKDQKTVTVLADALAVETPAYEGCVADGKTGLDKATAGLDEQADWYAKQGKTLEKAVTAVESSRTDRTVDAANALLKSSEGKVADEGTRNALAKAVKARDVQAIQAATVKVNDSVKTKADQDAQAQAEQAAQQAAAQAQASSGGQSTTGGGYTGGGYANTGYAGGSYNYGGGGYGGGSAAPSAPSTPAPSGGNGSSGGAVPLTPGAGVESNGNLTCDSSPAYNGQTDYCEWTW